MAHSLWISPSILAADLSDLKAELSQTEAAGADLIHWDVMDSHFVPNLTFGPCLIQACRPHTRLPFEAHLMVTDPLSLIHPLKESGCQYVSVHVEIKNPMDCVKEIRRQGMIPGVAISPDTSPNLLKSFLPMIEYVLVMTVSPGFAGQSFLSSSLARIKEIRSVSDPSTVRVFVDGGIKVSNALDVIRAGADTLVMGSGFFGTRNYAWVKDQIHSMVSSHISRNE